MKKHAQQRKKTLFKKLTLSYFLIITFMALVLSVTVHAVASRYYSREMQKLNSMFLRQAADVVGSSVLEPVRKVAMSLSLSSSRKIKLDDLLDGEELAKVAALCGELASSVTASQGSLAGIHVFFKQGDYVASSIMGYIRNTPLNRKHWPDMRWFEDPLLLPGSGTRTILRTLRYHQTTEAVPVITFVSPHPVTMPFTQASALIAIDVPMDYLADVLNNISGTDGRMLQLFDDSGRLILNGTDGAAAVDVSDMGYESNEACVQAEGEGVLVSVGGNRTLRSCALLPNGWMIVSHVPVNTFFAVNRTIGLFTALITLCTVLLFLLISRLFARRFYAPVERLMIRARQLLDRMEWQNTSKDELAQVDTVMMEMETKLLALSRDWEENLPTLKLAFMRSITEGEPISQQNFDRQLRYHARSMAEAQYRIMLLFISPNEDDATAQPVNDALISFVQRQSGKDIAFVAYERSEDCICALVLSSGEMTRSRMNGIIRYARRSLVTDITVAMGSGCSSPADIRQSFEQALQAHERSYFEEGNNLFVFEPLPELEGDLREELIKDLMVYGDILDKGGRDDLQAHVLLCMEHIADARIAPNAKHGLLAEYVSALNARMRNDDGRFIPAQASRSFNGITAFGAWLTQASALLISQLSGESRSKEAVESVVGYIQANLSQDLSLTRLSEYTMLSRNYLSRIFKEHMGVNLVDYITRCRMDKAAEMLSNTRLPIEQIARALGYNTPHYFSKRFREHSGLTPNQYRLR